MINSLLEVITGRDDLERVAYKENLQLLNAYLKKRPVFVPQRPKRLLDPNTMTSEQLVENLTLDMEELSNADFEPWILEVNGKLRLPVFSSQKRMKAFSARISTEMNRVFGLGCVAVLLREITGKVSVDYVDLNPCNTKSWEIGVKSLA